MKTWVRRSLNTGALAAGALLIAAPAHAGSAPEGGAPALTPIEVPGAGCGAAAPAGCPDGATALDHSWSWAHYQETAHNNGVANGTQVAAPIQVPISVCGNAVAMLGSAEASCEPGKHSRRGHKGNYKESRYFVSAHNYGVANGTQVYAPIQVPVNVCGDALAILGAATADC